MAPADGNTTFERVFDCPLFSLLRTILSVDSTNILTCSSLFVHEEPFCKEMYSSRKKEETCANHPLRDGPYEFIIS